MWNMFKVNYINTRTTPMTSFWWRRSGVFIVKIEHISYPFSVSIVAFEQEYVYTGYPIFVQYKEQIWASLRLPMYNSPLFIKTLTT